MTTQRVLCSSRPAPFSAARLSHSSRCKPRSRALQPQALFGNLFGKREPPQQDEAASEQQEAVQRLLDSIEGTERGLNPDQREAVLAAAAGLVVYGAGQTTTNAEALSGTWRLLWTTEKETLFILEKAGWFGTKAGETCQVNCGARCVSLAKSLAASGNTNNCRGAANHGAACWSPVELQVIDVEGGTLQNVITFPPAGAFIVDSSIEIVGPQRTEFQFTGATLLTEDRALKLPPFGKGW